MRKVQLLLACLVFSVAAFAADKVIKVTTQVGMPYSYYDETIAA